MATITGWSGERRDGATAARRRVRFGATGAALLTAILGGAWWLSPWALLFLLQVSALIVVHEGGHLVVARRCGMVTTEFFVGFGPVVLSVRRGETTWGIKALPIGGFVKIPGMSAGEEVPAELEARSYRAASVPRRLATALAGPAANLLAAVAIFSVAAYLMGGPIRSAPDDSAASSPSGLAAVAPALGDGIDLAVETSTATVQALGDFVRAPFGTTTGADGAEVQNRFLSPVGASQVTQWTAEHDLLVWLQFVGLISVSLAVANLLPFPPLDGGHAVVAVVEGLASRIRGRRVSVSRKVTTTMAWATLAFFAVLTLGSLVLDLTDPLENPLAPRSAEVGAQVLDPDG